MSYSGPFYLHEWVCVSELREKGGVCADRPGLSTYPSVGSWTTNEWLRLINQVNKRVQITLVLVLHVLLLSFT